MARSSSKRRSGLRIVGRRGPSDVRRCLQRYARWLREQVNFPVRVPVYLSPRKELVTQAGGTASATFFGPFDRREEPYIRIAAGDYAELLRKHGRDNALSCYLHSLSHEVVHYRQWIGRKPMVEKGVIRKAMAMVDAYATCVDRPLETRDSDNAFIGTWNERFVWHLDHQRWADAERMVRAAWRTKSEDHLRFIYMSFCRFEQGRIRSALGFARRAHELKPRCPSALKSLVEAEYAAGHFARALEVCERIDARTLRSLAAGKCGEGLDTARKLKSDAFVFAAWSLEQLDRPAEALKRLQRHFQFRARGARSQFSPAEVRDDERRLRRRLRTQP